MSGGNGRDEKHEAIETVQEVVEITAWEWPRAFG